MSVVSDAMPDERLQSVVSSPGSSRSRRPPTRRAGVAGARVEGDLAARVLALVAVDELARGLVEEHGVLVVHRPAVLAVGEDHVGLDLLAEVLHEALGARGRAPP
jgi:hypothetical protein